MDPKVASELSLRIPHLPLRMREHSARARHFATGLQALGARVSYPGLPSHPQHALLRRLANPGYGSGGMLTLELGSLDAAKCFMERLQNKHSFGGLPAAPCLCARRGAGAAPRLPCSPGPIPSIGPRCSCHPAPACIAAPRFQTVRCCLLPHPLLLPACLRPARIVVVPPQACWPCLSAISTR
jgi:hypothetical protein